MSSTPDIASRTATTKSAEPARETTQNGSGAGEDDRQEGSRAEGDHEGARSEAESANPRGHRHSRLQALALGPKPARDLVPNPGRQRGACFGTARAARTAAPRSADVGRSVAGKAAELRRTMARFEEPREPARGHGLAVEHDRGRRLRRDHFDAPHPWGCTSGAAGRPWVPCRGGVGLSTLGRPWGRASDGEPTAVQLRRADEGGPAN